MYILSDLKSSEQIKIEDQNEILLIVNDNPKYISFLQNLLRAILYLHDVKINIIAFECYDNLSDNILYQIKNDFPNNIKIINFTFNHKDTEIKYAIKKGLIPIQYIKPIAIKQFISDPQNKHIKKLLYLDADIFPLRRLDNLFDYLDDKPLIVKELGIDIDRPEKLANILNKTEIYRYIEIPNENRWLNSPPPNSGVLGFKLDRDTDIIEEWYSITKHICSNNLMNLIAWWDQGTLILALEKLGMLSIVTEDTSYHKTVLIENSQTYRNLNLSQEPSSLVHFIGVNKFNIIGNINENNKIQKLKFKIFIPYADSKEIKSIHPRTYIDFVNLKTSKIDQKYKNYISDKLDIYKIYMLENIVSNNIDYDIVGCILPQWNNLCSKKIDHIYNWDIYKYLEQIKDNPNIVICGSSCNGIYSRPSDPLWKQNFQKHFREEFSDSEHIQEKIYKISNLTYDGIGVVPYGNQIICHREQFNKVVAYAQEIIPKTIDIFGNSPEYNVPKPEVSLAYILEEIFMLWWSNQKCLHFIPNY